VSSGYLRKITLRGDLGERFGREHWLDVSTAGEAIRAIEANRPGFYAHLWGIRNEIDFAVLIGDKGECLDETQGDHPLGSRSLEFVPVVRGSGSNGGTWSIVIGVVLIAIVTVLTWGGGTGPMAVAVLGEGLVGTALLAVGMIGVSLILSGVSQLLSPVPKTQAVDSTTAQESDKLASYQFSGPVNAAGQGNPVPIVYGELIVGSQVVSMGIQSGSAA